MFNTLKIKNDEVIITQNPPVEKDGAGIKQAIVTRYLAVCEWFGIEDCKVSQIWFFGFFGVSIFMMIATYVISGVCYGF
ncbi:hypothetical protein [Bacillus pseudomycoides]|uniref:hypothetical protein n=1 Tax=Bacillus pseudomycoides TaxID=64104 RepID=UPI000503B4FB|nr:hypothetical protein [Bacillus pseudomycoides]KFN11940.1 hypothetical protein DJ94_5317 [Bacillus pseudomycoides]MDR4188094.1 hypothetical protein [Bacillus pseudomycoides]MED0855815.1 hypothetical protein [Bacillus pseudomycoides]PFW93910.1 hypothetical protein COL29_12280 [Bacillus pseudomycoides]PFX43515.1 hypothetical protein COL32_14370 [Bacillus pseudomycoides]